MLAVVDGPLARLRGEMTQMELDFTNQKVTSETTPIAIQSLRECITSLEAILNDMADIQDFNELVDMVRGMIDDQGKIIDQTKQEQKKKVLDLFNQ
jgi:phosphotransferase system IIB component